MAKPRTQHTRPSVDLGTSDIKREWQDVFPDHLSKGDIVSDFGIVEETFAEEAHTVTVVNSFGRRTFDVDKFIFAFTAVR